MPIYKVAGRPLTVNGETLAVGSKIDFDEPDGSALIALGRLSGGGKSAAKLTNSEPPQDDAGADGESTPVE